MDYSWVLACASGVAMLGGLMAFAADREPAPELKVPFVKDAQVKIDGALDDPIWSKAAVTDHFRLTDGAMPKGRMRLLVAQDQKNLYIGVEVFGTEDQMKKLVATHHTHDASGIWDDDVVELFIDPTNERKSYCEFIINSQGVTFDAYHRRPGRADTKWDPKYQAAARVNKTSWTVELALPLDMFDRHPRPRDKWMFNVLVFRTADNEYCYWSPVYQESAHAPDKFGTLTGLVIPEDQSKSQPAAGPAAGPASGPAPTSRPA
ncbi:MAG: carbohydrate-binding family 9-like protein [Phycisphaerae bacterium]